MYDNGVGSNASLSGLKEEVFILQKALDFTQYPMRYPNFICLFEEFKAELNKSDEQAAQEFWTRSDTFSQKINLIKWLRLKYPEMSLLEAKVYADGWWLRFEKIEKDNKNHNCELHPKRK